MTQGSNPRHILLLHQLFVLGREAGGTRHMELGRRLTGKGHRVTVIASPLSYLTGRAHEGANAVEDAEGIRVHRVWTWASDKQGFLGRLAGFVSFMVASVIRGLRVPGVDVVWGTSPPLPQALGALVIARLRRVPFVLEIRDLWPDFAVELGVLRNPTLIGIAHALERLLYQAADEAIVNSPGFVEHVRRVAGSEVSITLVPNGVEVEDFDPAARGEAFRAEVGVGADDVLVVYAGAHGIPNDLGVVLDAAERLQGRPDIRIALVGGGRDKDRLVADAEARGLSNVIFVAPQPKERMPEVVAACDVALAILRPLPLFNTTYPNKVFDYMAAGRPTILAIDGVIREVVEAGQGGQFVPPGDATALADTILAYADDAERRKREGESARSWVSENFSRAEHADRLAELMERATAS